ncbi:hypothetical protein [Granulicella arctica]|uniref:Uncharacterized protein n=1 Tax=Granulicella arctica TaxID=940613 RepID=A0A7Y9PHX5_9BACT|nr:hypothetical protein [Granulicella arctica]NYF80228.1 hypothetical protein [Granulicella arctica]
MQRIATSLLLISATILPLASEAQTTIAPPTSGLIISYQYWPEQFVQYVGTELPYSMLELDVNRDTGTPLYNVVLTERATTRRIQYSNSDAIIAAAKAQGNEAHKTEIAFEPADTTNIGSISTLRLTLADGKPLQWRFVQGSDISEQGSGLTALPQVPVPVFAYREQAAVAGEGTALQIGDIVSIADVWKEISKPPYFVAYHGAYTLSAHRLMFGAGKESWTVLSAPTSLAVGSTWELGGDHDTHRTLKVEHVDGNHYIISGSDSLQPAIQFVLDATRLADTWSVGSVRYSPVKNGDKHAVTVQFGTLIGPTTSTSTVELIVGKKTSLASGTLVLSGNALDRTAVLEIKTPTWAHGKSLLEETISSNGNLTTSSHLQEQP